MLWSHAGLTGRWDLRGEEQLGPCCRAACVIPAKPLHASPLRLFNLEALPAVGLCV